MFGVSRWGHILLWCLGGKECFARGVVCIPHGLEKKRYDDLLNLKWDGIEDRKDPETLALDVEPHEPAALPDPQMPEAVGSAASAEVPAHASDEPLDIEDEVLKLLEEDLEMNSSEVEGESHHGKLPMPPAATPPDPHEGLVEPCASSSSGPVIPAAAPLEAGPAPEETEQDGALQELLNNRNWGAFRITARNVGQCGAGRYGGYQATCPFHKLSDKSGCKRWFAIKGPTVADKHFAAKKLMMWCCSALSYDRQRDHLRCDIDMNECPSLETLLADRIPMAYRPEPGSIKTDAELDALAEAPAAAAAIAVATSLPGSANNSESSSSSSSSSTSSSSS
jgi:hypothetical protein